MSIRRKIALVEDSTDISELLTLFLNEMCDGFEVCPFLDGAKFLGTFHAAAYGAVILDIALPGIDGYEVLRHIRSIDSGVPVIAFTAHAGRNYREQAIQAGFTEVATKPIEDMKAFCQMVIDLSK